MEVDVVVDGELEAQARRENDLGLRVVLDEMCMLTMVTSGSLNGRHSWKICKLSSFHQP